MTETTGRDSSVVTSATRPVPLDYEYSTETLSDTLRGLVRNDKAPVYVVSYSQNGAIDLATNLLSVDLASKEQKAAIAAAIKGFTFGKDSGPACANCCCTASASTTPECCRSTAVSSNSSR